MKKLLFSTLILSNFLFATQTTTVTPVNGSGTTATFTLTTTDTNGVNGGNVQWIDLVFGSATPGVPGCRILYYGFPVNVIFLRSSDGNSWLGGYHPGQAVTFSNDYCDLPFVSAVGSFGNNFSRLVVSPVFKPAFAGDRGIFVQSADAANYVTPYVMRGIWTVPAPAMDISITAVEINTHTMLLDDATGQLIERPTSLSPWSVRLKNGKNVHVAAADNVRVGKISHSWEPIGDEFNYHFKIDTSDNPYIMRVGIVEDEITPIGATPRSTNPGGWLPMGVGWVNLEGKADLSEESEFSLQSKWRPGLQAIFIMSHDAKKPLPSYPETENNERIATAASIFNNSVRRFVIGPAIAPDLSEDGMKELIGRWVDDYGFAFLGPLLDGKPLSEIRTDDAFEQQILDCLRAAQRN